MDNFLIAFFKAVGIGAVTYVSGLMLGITTITLSVFTISITALLFIDTFSYLKEYDELYKLKKKQ